MLRAFCFVLALVVCASNWSTANAAPLAKTVENWGRAGIAAFGTVTAAGYAWRIHCCNSNRCRARVMTSHQCDRF
jgi:hypothetical protein